MNFMKCDGFESNVFYASFSHDCLLLSVGKKHSYSLYEIKSVQELNHIHTSKFDQACLCERFYKSSLVLLTSMSSPRTLNICNFKKSGQKEIWKQPYPNTVLAVKMNRQVFVVVMETTISIHGSNDMALKHLIKGTPRNPDGIIALSADKNKPRLAYPVSADSGEVQLFDYDLLRNGAVVRAHQNKIAAISFDSTCSMMATASNKGTIIRVFDVSANQDAPTKLYEFRRGSNFARIHSMRFDPASQHLVVSSNRETVHVFKLHGDNRCHVGRTRLDSETADENNQDKSWVGSIVGSLVTTTTSYLPTPFQDSWWSQSRSHATCKLPGNQSDMKTLCGFATVGGRRCILVVGSNGVLYVYDFHGNQGGECPLLRQHQLDIHGDAIDPEEDLHGEDCGVATETYAHVTSMPPSGSGGKGKVLGNFDNSLPGSPLNYSGEFPSIQ